MKSDFDKELKRIKGLVQNKGKTEEELIPQVRKNLIVRNFRRNPLFSYDGVDPKVKEHFKKEQSLAEEKFKSYLENNQIESDSDIDTLTSVVYNEIFEKRIQAELNKLQAEGKYPPEKLTKQLSDVQNQKLNLKKKLGIDKDEQERDEVSAFELAKKRVIKHVNENRHEHSIGIGHQCPECGHKDWKEYLLWYKVKDFKAMKHPWFVGRWLANIEILKDVKSKRLTKEDAMRYLVCASQGGDYKQEYKKYCGDYIDYCLKNWHELEEFLK